MGQIGQYLVILTVFNKYFFDNEKNFAKRCLIQLVGGPRHFASEIGPDVTYFDPFRGFKRGQFGS